MASSGRDVSRTPARQYTLRDLDDDLLDLILRHCTGERNGGSARLPHFTLACVSRAMRRVFYGRLTAVTLDSPGGAMLAALDWAPLQRCAHLRSLTVRPRAALTDSTFARLLAVLRARGAPLRAVDIVLDKEIGQHVLCVLAALFGQGITRLRVEVSWVRRVRRRRARRQVLFGQGAGAAGGANPDWALSHAMQGDFGPGGLGANGARGANCGAPVEVRDVPVPAPSPPPPNVFDVPVQAPPAHPAMVHHHAHPDNAAEMLHQLTAAHGALLNINMHGIVPNWPGFGNGPNLAAAVQHQAPPPAGPGAAFNNAGPAEGAMHLLQAAFQEQWNAYNPNFPPVVVAGPHAGAPPGGADGGVQHGHGGAAQGSAANGDAAAAGSAEGARVGASDLPPFPPMPEELARYIRAAEESMGGRFIQPVDVANPGTAATPSRATAPSVDPGTRGESSSDAPVASFRTTASDVSRIALPPVPSASTAPNAPSVPQYHWLYHGCPLNVNPLNASAVNAGAPGDDDDDDDDDDEDDEENQEDAVDEESDAETGQEIGDVVGFNLGAGAGHGIDHANVALAGAGQQGAAINGSAPAEDANAGAGGNHGNGVAAPAMDLNMVDGVSAMPVLNLAANGAQPASVDQNAEMNPPQMQVGVAASDQGGDEGNDANEDPHEMGDDADGAGADGGADNVPANPAIGGAGNGPPILGAHGAAVPFAMYHVVVPADADHGDDGDADSSMQSDTVMFSDDVFTAVVARCPNLRHLTLEGAKNLTDTGIEVLSKCKMLEGLVLCNLPHVSDDGLAPIVSDAPKLRLLHLRYMERISEKTLYALTSKPRVMFESLDITCNHRITDQCTRRVVNSCEGLKSVVLRNCSQLTNASLSHLSCARNLRVASLEMTGGSPITNRSALYLSCAAASLRVLSLGACNRMGVDGVVALSKLPGLVQLRLHGLGSMTQDAMRILGGNPVNSYPRLEHLTLQGSLQLTDLGVTVLCGQRGHRFLHLELLDETRNLSDEALDVVGTWCSSLRFIRILGHFSSDAVDQLKDTLPGCEVRTGRI